MLRHLRSLVTTLIAASAASAHAQAASAAAPVEPKSAVAIDEEPWTRPRLGLHLASRHDPANRPSGKKFNNSNPGVYVQWRNGITVGAYRNSQDRDSAYAGWTWTRSKCGPALTMGVVAGYTKGTTLFAVPSICFADHVRLTFVPKAEPKGANVLHLSVEF